MTQDSPDGPRIAKLIARAGLASRRDAERMIAEGRVRVNGRPVDGPALNVGPKDRVTVDGKPLPQAEGARLWLYHKPAGLVTTERDEKDRETVFDALRDRLGRVLSVGRLDLTSEGLLLLTNDGDLKRRLELPETGWLRRYRVRVNGTPEEAALERLRAGIAVDGERFGAMQVTLDRQKGSNAWLTVGLREGRNREVRRAAEAVGLVVNRLIRVSYGPFQLGALAAGEVEEVKPRVLREQLGALWDGDLAETRRAAPRPPRHEGDRLVDKGRGKPGGKAPKGKGGDRGPRPRADEAGARRDKPRTAKPPVTRNDGKDAGGRAGGGPKGRDGRPSEREDRAARGADRPRGDRPWKDKPRRDAAPGGRGSDGEKRPWKDRPRRDGEAARPDRPRRAEGDGPRRVGKPWERREGDDRPRGDGPRREDRPRGGKPSGEKPRRDDRPAAPKQTKTERKAAMRADTSVSLRKGGQRGKGIAKAKPQGGKSYVKPPKPKP